MARIVREVQPRFVFVENSPMLTSRGLGRVLGDLAAMGFDAEWGVVSAADVGAPHKRERIWILANSVRDGFKNRPNARRRNCVHGFDGKASQENGKGHCIDGACSDCAVRQFDSYAHGQRQLQPQRLEQDQRGRVGDCGDAKDMAHGRGHGHGLQGVVTESQPRNDGRQAGLLGGAGVFPAWPADPADAPESRVGRSFDGMAK